MGMQRHDQQSQAGAPLRNEIRYVVRWRCGRDKLGSRFGVYPNQAGDDYVQWKWEEVVSLADALR